MARHVGGFIGTIVIGGLLAGCGLRMFAEREPWRGQAERECIAQKGVQPTAFVEPMPAINGSSSCGMDYPFRVAALGNGTVALTSRAVLACPAINTLDHWVAEVVQPATQLYFGTTVVAMKTGSYSCRGPNGQAGGKLSEHAFGNAADIFALHFADGREVTVERGWRGDPREQEFLREIFTGACSYFSTVLAPGSDAFHYNHFHVDLARRSSGRSICKPAIQFASRLRLARAHQQQADETTAALPEDRFGQEDTGQPMSILPKQAGVDRASSSSFASQQSSAKDPPRRDEPPRRVGSTADHDNRNSYRGDLRRPGSVGRN